MKETEIAQYFVDYFSCYDLYFEVDYGRCVDIVAISDKVSIAIEVKTSFNFKVLEQAAENRYRFNYSYIAVPAFKDSRFQERLCSDYGVGLLVLEERVTGWDENRNLIKEYVIKSIIGPKLNRKASLKRLMPYLHERNKQSLPGSKSGDGTKITAFGITVDNLVRYVSRYKGCTLKQAVNDIDHHYDSEKSAKSNLYQWIKSGVISEIEISDGKLYPKKQKDECEFRETNLGTVQDKQE